MVSVLQRRLAGNRLECQRPLCAWDPDANATPFPSGVLCPVDGPPSGDLEGGQSYRGVPARLELCHLGPANERVSDAEPSGCHDEAQAAPGAEDGPAVAVFHVVGQAVDQLREAVQVIGDAGGVRAEGNGAKDPCHEEQEAGHVLGQALLPEEADRGHDAATEQDGHGHAQEAGSDSSQMKQMPLILLDGLRYVERDVS